MSAKVRVLEVIKGLDVGGAEKLLVERLRVTDPSRIDTDLAIVDGRRTTLVPDVTGHVNQVHVLSGMGFGSPLWVLRVTRLISGGTYDVVHVHSPAVAVVLRLLLRAVRRRPRLVVTEHSVGYRRVTTAANAATIRLDDHVIAVSDAVAQGRAASRAGGRVTVIRHGVDLESLRRMRERRADCVKELGLAGPLRVVTVANLRPEKDLATLARAAAVVLAECPGVTFYLAGSGPEEASLRRIVHELGIGTRFVLLGAVENAARLTSCADVFALSSVHEGLPVAVMEALGCGVPVVSTSVGGIPELIQPGVSGQLIEPRNPARLAEEILRILKSDQHREMLGVGATSAAETLDIRATAQKIAMIYQNLADQGDERDA